MCVSVSRLPVLHVKLLEEGEALAGDHGGGGAGGAGSEAGPRDRNGEKWWERDFTALSPNSWQS